MNRKQPHIPPMPAPDCTGHDEAEYEAWRDPAAHNSVELSPDGRTILAAIETFRSRLFDPHGQFTQAELEFIKRILPAKPGADASTDTIELYQWFRRAEGANRKDAIGKTADVLGKSFTAVERDTAAKST